MQKETSKKAEICTQDIQIHTDESSKELILEIRQDDKHKFVYLNESAALIFNLLRRECSQEEIVIYLKKEYGLTISQIQKAVQKVKEPLHKIGIF